MYGNRCKFNDENHKLKRKHAIGYTGLEEFQ